MTLWGTWPVDKDGNSRPRVIRRVIRNDAKGNPKVARDYKYQITLQRIKPLIDHVCDSPHCAIPIRKGEPYVQATALRDVKRIGSNMFPDIRKYHPDCVPERARPLVRLLFRYHWVSETCTAEYDDVAPREWVAAEMWEQWVKRTYPRMAAAFHYEGNDGIQYGTGYHWSVLRPIKHKP
jgi:hypothetical protein